ncbi:hypothetical protein [Bacillus velezensis]|uniref:hypothetical protein n=1 Tax=Bacillus velezensis TaxID=492670 RepID=UPI002DBC09B5|nr:hypothetical protein [Bacillus velezensis]MEC3848600.1 hypothetical protein [Bacillus velezensis]
MTETKKYVRIKKAKFLRSWYSVYIGRMYIVIGKNESEYITHVGDVLKEDAELFVTEKRPAKVGERVLITKALPMKKQAYEAGDIFEVATANDPFTKAVRVFGMPSYIDYREYEVIVNNEIKNEEADGMKIDLNAMGYDELIAHGEDVIRAIRLRAYGEGYRQGKFDAEMDYTHGQAPIVSAQSRRDEIVEQAKADVERLKETNIRLRTFNISLEVNRKDRSVEAIAKRPKSNRAFYGIAKAAPDDCFNVHIGKAIAIRRALGLAVPDEYLNAPQPTEVRVGDVIMPSVLKKNTPRKVVATDVEVDAIANVCCLDSIMATNNATIIDDSREEVGE